LWRRPGPGLGWGAKGREVTRIIVLSEILILEMPTSSKRLTFGHVYVGTFRLQLNPKTCP